MDQNVVELLRQGLMLTVLGMGLAFLGLAGLWGLMALLMRLFRPPSTEATAPALDASAEAPPSAEAAALTAERAQIAALVAAAFLASAVPLQLQAPAGPTFEHGRTAPGWVSTNRARALQSWQPGRRLEL